MARIICDVTDNFFDLKQALARFGRKRVTLTVEVESSLKFELMLKSGGPGLVDLA